MRNVSKFIFLNALKCSTLGWLLRTGQYTSPSPTLGEQFRFEQGRDIGRRARALYPDGLLIADVNLTSARRKTEEALQSLVPVIFEGAFLLDGYAARADILERRNGGWHMVEVKSGTNDRADFIYDMTFTYLVAESCGLEISGVSLFLISREYRLGMADENLFVEIDHTDEVLEAAEEVRPLWKELEEITRAAEKPDPQLKLECRRCDIFNECLGKGIDHHIFTLPRLSQSRFDMLADMSIERIEDIPAEFDLTEYQARVRDSVLGNQPDIREELREDLEAIEWPAYYLDFETMMTAVPLYSDTAPYTQIPTQYSVHLCSGIGKIPEHREYLADPSRDSRRELAERLIADLGEQGSIIAYSNFEKSIINALAQLYPDLSVSLNALSERIIDLEAIIRHNYYHPEFNGSTSIKVTLPVLVADMSYKSLKINEGDSAAASFAYLVMGRHWKPYEIEKVKQDLLKYCKQDTLAMVRLHEKLAEVVELG